MYILIYILFGFLIASFGSITPSFLNLTVVKFSLKTGKKSAFFLIGGYVTVLFFQANIGAYFANVLMKNSEYIKTLQIIGTVILFFLSVNFFRLYYTKKASEKKEDIKRSKAYLYGLFIASLNTIAIPFYFTSISFLIGYNYFEYSLLNGLYFSVGSTLGSYFLYSMYAIVATKIEHKLMFVASKMDFILGCLTGFVGVINVFLLLKS